ncbi:MAG: cytochrome c oxidase assembly protein [Geminicoccaceae bacterium]
MSRQRAPGKTLTVALLASVVIGMLGLTAAAVPLYRLFCQVTGYGGTTQRAEAAPDRELEQTIRVRFNADIDPDLPWSFQPEQRQIEVQIGEQNLAFYRARNRSDHPIVGQAVYNVTPFKAGPYFSKIACFCFEEQVLQPGEEVDMPVSFYVDPAILTDPNTQDVHTITLSYTFFLLEDQSEALETDQAARPAS